MPPELALPPDRPSAGHASCWRKPGSSTPTRPIIQAPRCRRPPDQFDQRGPLHTHIGGWMEQEAAKLPEPDGVPPQADGEPVQGKRLRAGGEQAKGGLDRFQRRKGGTTHWRLPGAEGKAAAIQPNPPYRQPERQRRAPRRCSDHADADPVVPLVVVKAPVDNRGQRPRWCVDFQRHHNQPGQEPSCSDAGAPNPLPILPAIQLTRYHGCSRLRTSTWCS